MNLEKLYFQIEEKIKTLDFAKIWPGFKVLKYALFDQDKCFFDGKYIAKTAEFCANTSINYHGEQIATWMIDEDIDINILTSKMVHEMFHGFQTINNWACWPNEVEALFKYRYHEENLALKLKENQLLVKLVRHFNVDDFEEMLALKHTRMEKYPYEFSYESKTEEIEGAANFVEWQVLNALDKNMAEKLSLKMQTEITNPAAFFTIRLINYYTGALLFKVLSDAKEDFFNEKERPVIFGLIEHQKGANPLLDDALLSKVKKSLDQYNAETKAIIDDALAKNALVKEGLFKLMGLNIYDARFYNNYLTTTYFLAYLEDDTPQTIFGDYIIHMFDEKTIDKIYRWER